MIISGGNMSKEKKVENQTEKINSFSELLDSLSKTEDKKKLLWKEAYQNALDDRENANILLVDLLKVSIGNTANQIQFGPMMSKYLERMSKSNDQILKLAELIAKEQEEADTMSDDEIFSKING